MSRRKLIAAITLVSLLVVSGALCGVYMYFYSSISAQMSDMSVRYENIARSAVAQGGSAEEIMLSFMAQYGSAFADEAPCYAAIVDADGRLLAEPRDMLRVDPAVMGYQETKTEAFWVELSPYMTQEIRDRLLEAASGAYEDLYPERFTLAGGSGGYRPVQMEAHSYSSLGARGKTVSVVFSGLPEQRELTSDDGLRLFLYDLHKDKALRAALSTMREQVLALPEKMKAFRTEIETASGESPEEEILDMEISSLVSVSRDIRQNLLAFSLGGERAFFILQYAFRVSPLVFRYHSGALALTAAVLIFLYFAVLILALWYRGRREALAHTRYSFLSAAAHELKTPLSVIVSAGECIEGAVSPEKDREYAGMILREGERMRSLLEDMLRQNRLTSADRVQKERTDLSALVLRETEKYAAAAAQKEIDLQTEIVPGVFADCDPGMIAMAVDNFLSNAVKYAPEKAEIIVRVGREGKRARVSVHNTGSGISPAALPHIWEELYREDKVRASGEGSGLGLSIARRIFELHRARYGCVSDASGVTFRFSLPSGRRKPRTAKPKKENGGRRRWSHRLFAWGPLALICTGALLLYYVSAFSGGVGIALESIGNGLVGLGDLTGLLFILRTALYWKDPSQPKNKAAFFLTILAISLPLLFIGYLYFALAMGWA